MNNYFIKWTITRCGLTFDFIESYKAESMRAALDLFADDFEVSTLRIVSIKRA